MLEYNEICPKCQGERLRVLEFPTWIHKQCLTCDFTLHADSDSLED